MNGAIRFFAIAFLLALCYHWLGEDDWSDMEEDVQDSREDIMLSKFSQSLHRKSGDRMVKGEGGHFKPDLEDLQSSKLIQALWCNPSGKHVLQKLMPVPVPSNHDRSSSSQVLFRG